MNSPWKRWLPTLIVLAIFLLPLLLISPKTYITLTISGLAMGMLLFLVASGFSLIFGFLSVLNLAHGALFTWGAYIGFTSFSLINQWTGWGGSDSIFLNIIIFLLALIIAGLLVALLGIITERIVIRPVYGSHLFQIFITVGAMIVMEELIRIVWGPNDEVMPVPIKFMGSWDLFDVVVSKYPLIAIVIGLILYLTLFMILRKTKIGTIVRAGVENPEMVQVMGHNIYRYFTGVFAAGSALAAIGGGMWATFVKSIHPAMGGEVIVFALIVAIIGGLGSMTGSVVGALLVGLSYNYVAYLVPKAALGITMLLLVIILSIRPTGLFPEGT
ncbi:MAG: branched-chain amino acid ABC transporter permease [Thermodesulfobacteriota bacterium]|nr:branched-chain amino acid ABC transporter permease [Thermodesulfobacteriota bacterium]